MVYYYIFLALHIFSLVSYCWAAEAPIASFEKKVVVYSFLEPQAKPADNERLYISHSHPIGVSYRTGEEAKANQFNNIPDPQFWVKPTEEQDKSNYYNLRYSFDKKKINVNYLFTYPKNNQSNLLFDGPNNNNHILHAQVDDIGEKSEIYLVPTTLKKYDYTDPNQKPTYQKDVKGTITAIALYYDNPVIIAYCCTKNNNTLSLNILPTLPLKKKTFTLNESLKRILILNNESIMSLGSSGKLYHATKENLTKLEIKLKLKDIAFDHTSKRLAFLDTNGNVYTTTSDLNSLNNLTHVHTIEPIALSFVKRISYSNDIISVFYHTAHLNDTLIHGECEQIYEKEIIKNNIFTVKKSIFLLISGAIIITALLLYNRYK